MNSKVKCEECKYLKCVDVSYKTYYCMAEEDTIIVNLGVDYPPKRPPKSCPLLKGDKVRRVLFHLGTGFPGASYEEVIEFDSDTTDEEIDEFYKEWKNDRLDCSWVDVE